MLGFVLFLLSAVLWRRGPAKSERRRHDRHVGRRRLEFNFEGEVLKCYVDKDARLCDAVSGDVVDFVKKRVEMKGVSGDGAEEEVQRVEVKGEEGTELVEMKRKEVKGREERMEMKGKMRFSFTDLRLFDVDTGLRVSWTSTASRSGSCLDVFLAQRGGAGQQVAGVKRKG